MSSEITKDLDGARAFEERVFARFDAVDENLRGLDSRLQVVESRAYDTKPIWERALKEILETRLEMVTLTTKVGALEGKVAAIEGKVAAIEGNVAAIEGNVGALGTKVESLEGKVGTLETSMRGLEHEMNELRHHIKREVTNRLDQILIIQVENRQDLRDTKCRVEHLESRLS